MQRFTVLTLNVHSWNGPNFRPNEREVAELLQKARADVACLNEARSCGASLSTVARLSGLPHVHFADADFAGFGNAVLSRFPLQSAETIELSGSCTAAPSMFSSAARRSAALCAVALPASAAAAASSQQLLHVVATHLDHISEDD